MIEDYYDSPISKHGNSVMNTLRDKIDNKYQFILALHGFTFGPIDSNRP